MIEGTALLLWALAIWAMVSLKYARKDVHALEKKYQAAEFKRIASDAIAARLRKAMADQADHFQNHQRSLVTVIIDNIKAHDEEVADKLQRELSAVDAHYALRKAQLSIGVDQV